MDKTKILKIYESPQSIFTLEDISLITGEKELNALKSNLNYYTKTGKLLSLRRGIYAKNQNYDILELATRIYTPSYISFETVLSKNGVIFQYDNTTYVASYLSRQITVDGKKYVFRKIKNEILISKNGLKEEGNYFSACLERAFLDILYLYKDYHFDNLQSIDWDKCCHILPIYKNIRLEKTVSRLKKIRNDKNV